MHSEMLGEGRRSEEEVECAQRSLHGAEGGSRAAGWRSAAVVAACGAVVLVGMVGLWGQPHNAGELIQAANTQTSTAKRAAMMRLAVKTAGAPTVVAAEKGSVALELVRVSDLPTRYHVELRKATINIDIQDCRSSHAS